MKNKMHAVRRQLLGFLFGTIFLLVTPGVSAAGRASAIRSIGLGASPFSCKKIEADLKAKSYFRLVCLKENLSGKRQDPERLRKLSIKYQVDGVLISRSKTRMDLVHARSGKILAVLSGKSLESESALGSALVAEYPYRGFITSIDDDKILINVGSSQGIRVGQYLKVFEFVETKNSVGFLAPRIDLGVIQVTVVGVTSAEARIVDGEPRVTRFAKIAHEDAPTPTQSALAPTAVEGKSQISLGIEQRTVETEAKDVSGANRDYTMNTTPFITLGVAKKNLLAQMAYGYASNSSATLSYLSLQGAIVVRSIGTIKSGTTISCGVWYSQFNATQKTAAANTPLEDFSRYAPYAEVRYQRILNDKVSVAASGELAYLIFTNDQDLAKLFMSYALAFAPQIRIKASKWLMVDVGLRYQRIAVGIKSGVNTLETHSGPFARALITF